MYISNNLLHLQTLSPETSNPGSSKAGDYSKCMKSPVCISNQIDQEYRVQAVSKYCETVTLPIIGCVQRCWGGRQ